MRKNNKERVPRQVNYLWVLAGGYLMYLGAKLIYDVIRGSSTIVALNVVAGVIFIGVGAAVCLREWRIYRFGSEEEREALAHREEAAGDDETAEEEYLAENGEVE